MISKQSIVQFCVKLLYYLYFSLLWQNTWWRQRKKGKEEGRREGGIEGEGRKEVEGRKGGREEKRDSEFIFGSQFEGTVHHCNKGMVVWIWDSWSTRVMVRKWESWMLLVSSQHALFHCIWGSNPCNNMIHIQVESSFFSLIFWKYLIRHA